MLDDQWVTICPVCHLRDTLLVIEATLVSTGERLRFRSPLSGDGFLVPVEDAIKDQSTTDEVVRCEHCQTRFDLSELFLEED